MTGFFIKKYQNKDSQWIDLIQKAQRGDKKAYEILLHQLYPYIKSIIQKKIGALVIIDDLTQECLIGIHKNLASFNPTLSFKPWLFAIIRYKLADYFRQLTKNKDLFLEESLQSVTIQPEDKNYKMDNDVKNCLNQLPKNLKIAIIKTQIEGYSYSEVAETEGISEAALRKRISRGYSELRQLILKEKDLEFGYRKK